MTEIPAEAAEIGALQLSPTGDVGPISRSRLDARRGQVGEEHRIDRFGGTEGALGLIPCVWRQNLKHQCTSMCLNGVGFHETARLCRFRRGSELHLPC